MSDQPSGPLAEVARTIGGAAGKLVTAVTGTGAKTDSAAQAATGAQAPAVKENLWKAEYAGSGTFIIHKPKRERRKRRQQAVKSPRRGMRK